MLYVWFVMGMGRIIKEREKMKKDGNTLLLVTVVIGFITFYLFACTPKEASVEDVAKEQEEWLQELYEKDINKIIYIQDCKHNICFARYNARYRYALATIPCEKVKDDLVTSCQEVENDE